MAVKDPFDEIVLGSKPEDDWLKPGTAGVEFKQLEDASAYVKHVIEKQIPLAEWDFQMQQKVIQDGQFQTILEGIVLYCPHCGPVTIPARNLIDCKVQKDQLYNLDVQEPVSMYAKKLEKFTKVLLFKTHLEMTYRCDGCGLKLIARMSLTQKDGK